MKDTALKLDWHIDGMRYALARGDIVVVVDALRFSTAVTTAVAHGFTIYPVSDREKGRTLAASIGAEMSGRPGQSRFSISPRSFLDAGPGDNRHVVLYSPNGAACSELAGEKDTAVIGCFLNARSVGSFVSEMARQEGIGATIIAAGEQRALDTGERVVYEKRPSYPVFAIEDYLACGAIIGSVDMEKSAEARLCQLAFNAAEPDLRDLLLEGFSGRYLVEHGLTDDVDHAARMNIYEAVPIIRGGRICAASC